MTTDKYALRQREGRCVQIRWSGSNNWLSTGCRNLAQARRWAERELIGGGDEMLMKDYAKGFFEKGSIYRTELEKKGKGRMEYYYSYRQQVTDKIIIPSLGNYSVSSISPSDIDMFILGMERKRGDLSKPLKPSYISNVLNVLNIILDRAAYEEMIPSNPARKIILPSTRNKTAKRSLTREEMMKLFPDSDEELLRVWGDILWAVFFLIMAETGFRPSEVAGLKRSSIIKDENAVYTIGTYNTRAKEFVDRIKTTDSGQKYKIGLLSSRAMNLLSEYIETIPADRMELFIIHLKRCRNNGKQSGISYQTSWKKFNDVLKAKGISTENASEYSLRHTFMTRFAGEVPLDKLEELMGHTQWEACYDHRTPETIIRQMKKVIGS